MTDWVEELRWLGDWIGFQPDPQMRAANLEYYEPVSDLGIEWINAHDRALDDTAVEPGIGPNEEALLDQTIENLGGIGSFLYNAGTLHFLIDGEINDDFGRPHAQYRAIGLFTRNTNTAATTTRSNEISSIKTVEGVVTHEAGHAFTMTAAPLLHLHRALSEDIKSLEEELPDTVTGETFDQIRFFNDSRFFGPDFQKNDSLLVAQMLLDNEEERVNFPQTSAFLETIGYFDGDGPEMVLRLSRHPAIVEAYRSDLLDIINGEGPNGARFEVREVDFRGTMEERAQIIVETESGERVIDVDHYTPEFFETYFVGGEFAKGDHNAIHRAREEAMAEILSDIMTGRTPQDVGYYFPALTAEVTAIFEAVEVLSDQSNDLTKTASPKPHQNMDDGPLTDFKID